MTTAWARRGRSWAAGAAVAAAVVIPALSARTSEAPRRRDVDVVARRYAYDPPVITVNQGDEVHIRLASRDVTHGFYLEGYDLDALIEAGKTGFGLRRPSQSASYAPAKEIVFTAGRRGKFRYRCSMTCGYMHPFMQGVLIVRPNELFGTASGLMIGLLLAGMILAWPAAPVPVVPPPALRPVEGPAPEAAP